eukprot:COSAG06_NODE_4928_length_3854_cov_337.930226_2_plen_72_part_00
MRAAVLMNFTTHPLKVKRSCLRTAEEEEEEDPRRTMGAVVFLRRAGHIRGRLLARRPASPAGPSRCRTWWD